MYQSNNEKTDKIVETLKSHGEQELAEGYRYIADVQSDDKAYSELIKALEKNNDYQYSGLINAIKEIYENNIDENQENVEEDNTISWTEKHNPEKDEFECISTGNDCIFGSHNNKGYEDTDDIQKTMFEKISNDVEERIKQLEIDHWNALQDLERKNDKLQKEIKEVKQKSEETLQNLEQKIKTIEDSYTTKNHTNDSAIMQLEKRISTFEKQQQNAIINDEIVSIKDNINRLNKLTTSFRNQIKELEQHQQMASTVKEQQFHSHHQHHHQQQQFDYTATNDVTTDNAGEELEKLKENMTSLDKQQEKLDDDINKITRDIKQIRSILTKISSTVNNLLAGQDGTKHELQQLALTITEVGDQIGEFNLLTQNIDNEIKKDVDYDVFQQMLKTVDEINIRVKNLEEQISDFNPIAPLPTQVKSSVSITMISKDSTDEEEHEEHEDKEQPIHKDITSTRLVDKMPTILMIVIILCVKEIVLFLISYLGNPLYIPT